MGIGQGKSPSKKNIKNLIYTVRGLQVMVDWDLAELYGVETRRLNEQVKRNSERFPREFMFQLTHEEMEDWMSQIAISNKERMGLRKPPYAFTEQGVAMLSGVLKSKRVVQVNIEKRANPLLTALIILLYFEDLQSTINRGYQSLVAFCFLSFTATYVMLNHYYIISYVAKEKIDPFKYNYIRRMACR